MTKTCCLSHGLEAGKGGGCVCGGKGQLAVMAMVWLTSVYLLTGFL